MPVDGPMLTITQVNRFMVADLEKMRLMARAGLASEPVAAVVIESMDDADLAEWCVTDWQSDDGHALADYGLSAGKSERRVCYAD